MSDPQEQVSVKPSQEVSHNELMRVGEFVYNEEIYEVLMGVLHKLMEARGEFSGMLESPDIIDRVSKAKLEYIDDRMRESREMLRRIIPLGTIRFTPGGTAE
jgi:hypothetical protein